MKKNDLNIIDTEYYPYVIIPEKILSFLNKEKQNELYLDKLKVYVKEFTYNDKNGKKIFLPIQKILNLEIWNENTILENYDCYYDGRLLPKKPITYSYIKKEKKVRLIDEFTDYPIFSESLIFSIISFFVSLLLLYVFAVFHNLSIFKTSFVVGILVFSIIIIYRSINYSILSNSFKTIVEIDKVNKYDDETKKEFNEYKELVRCMIKSNSAEHALGDSLFTDISTIRTIMKPNVLSTYIDESMKGRSELFFFTKLFEKFGNQIYTDIAPNEGKNPFRPDFLLIDEVSGFHIDIEIDEPYSLKSGKVIHSNRSNNNLRDNYFGNINWGVIRFTEKQVLNEPEECCRYIQKVLNSIHYLNFEFNHNVTPEKKWTHEESIFFRENKYRDNY